jgi:hypothetical protein
VTATSQTADRPVSLPAAPAGIFAVLGLVDIALLGVIGSSVAPPLAVSIFIALLGLITLAALIPARRGSRSAFVAALGSRIVSALLAFAAFFASAPAWIMAIEAFVIVATIIALVLLRRLPRPRAA